MKLLNKLRRWSSAGIALILGMSLGCSQTHHDGCTTCENEHTCAACAPKDCAACAPKDCIACAPKDCPAPKCQAHGVENCPQCAKQCCPPCPQLPPVKPKPLLVKNLPPPAPAPICCLPPVSNERYIVPEKAVVKAPEPQIIVSQKPNLDVLRTLPAVEAEKPEPAMFRRSFPDITARPEFAHAPDYSWLIGELHFSPQKQQWRLRYASIDNEDRYGGSVTLDAAHVMSGFQDGQLVRVEGKLLDQDSKEPSPGFRVKDIQLFTSVSK
jgi:hypothetical protein